MTKEEKEENEGVGFEGGDDVPSIDLSSVEDDNFDIIPKGLYNIIIDEATYGLSNASQNPMISLTLVVEDGDYQGRKLFTHVVFSAKTMSMAKRTIKRLGLEELLQGPFNPEASAELFVGKRAKAKVGIQKYEGEDRNQVKGLLPPGEGLGEGFLDGDE